MVIMMLSNGKVPKTNDKKPTDNEIIRALECCTDGTGKGIIKAVLDLINRQKAEIEGLQKLVSLSIDTQNDLSDRLLQTEDNLKTAKAEAIKEFTERVDSMFAKIENELPKNKIVKATIQVYKDMLQIVKKEMVGE